MPKYKFKCLTPVSFRPSVHPQYITDLDYFNMLSTTSLEILPKFKTVRQTTDYTCGPCCILMLLNYFGIEGNELDIAEKCNTNNITGTNTEQLSQYFKNIGWDVSSSLDNEVTPSLAMLKENLKNGIPTLVEWLDLGGHWQVVIGYDTMGTDSDLDDVIIFADSYSLNNKHANNYYVYSAHRFLNMWFDAHLLPDNMKMNQWITAVPPTFKVKTA